MRVMPIQRYVVAALFCGLASMLVILITVSTTLRYRAPDIAIKVWPWNGEARGVLAGRMLLKGELLGAQQLAKQAVRQVPGDAISLRALGMLQPARETTGKALRIMQLATKASRRDLQTNLWFIEYYVSQGDITSAIRYYDYGLKSSAEAESLLFPVLVPAMENLDIAAAVRAKLITRPVWTTSFLQYSFSSGEADDHMIGIALSMAHDRIGLPIDLKRQYVQRLAERGNLQGLSRFVRGLGQPLLEGTSTLSKIGDFPPADWRLLSGPDLSTFSNSNAGFSFIANQNGTLSERILHLKPGFYSLHLGLRLDNEERDTRLLWSIACLPDNRIIPISAAVNQATFVVSKDNCSYQKLSLSIKNERLADGLEVSGSVTDMNVKRIHEIP